MRVRLLKLGQCRPVVLRFSGSLHQDPSPQRAGTHLSSAETPLSAVTVTATVTTTGAEHRYTNQNTHFTETCGNAIHCERHCERRCERRTTLTGTQHSATAAHTTTRRATRSAAAARPAAARCGREHVASARPPPRGKAKKHLATADLWSAGHTGCAGIEANRQPNAEELDKTEAAARLLDGQEEPRHLASGARARPRKNMAICAERGMRTCRE